MFLLYEEQATYIFSEVSKVVDSSNLCLPLSLELQVKKKRDVARAVAAARTARQVADFRYMLNSAKGDASRMVVPFAIRNIDVTTLLTSAPMDGAALMESKPFKLSLIADEKVIGTFLPVNIEKSTLSDFYTTVASFRPNMNTMYSKIRLASELKLKFSIDETKLDLDHPFALSEKVKTKVDEYYLDVELPSDLMAKKQEKEKFEGT